MAIRTVPSASSSAPQMASSAWLSAPSGRTAVTVSELPSSSQAASERVSAIRLQSATPHERPRWPRQSIRPPGRGAGDAAEPLVARHAAEARRVVVLRELGRRRGGGELELEARAAGRVERDVPASVWLERPHDEAREPQLVPVRARVQRSAALGDDPDRLAAREQDAESTALQALGPGGGAGACEPEEAGDGIGERERGGVGEPFAAGQHRLAHAEPRGSPSASTSTAVPSTSVGRAPGRPGDGPKPGGRPRVAEAIMRSA